MTDVTALSPSPTSGPAPTRVLLVEDHPDHRHLFARQLGSFQQRAQLSLTADTLGSAKELLQERADEIDVVVADLGLPDASGAEVIDGIIEVAPHKPIVVLSARLEQGVEAMRAGAQDYLVKGETNARDLEQAIRHAITRQGLVNELRTTTRDAEQLVYSVSHDLRGPLSVASGFVSLLEKAALPAEAEHLVPPIRRSLARLESITDDLMTYARSVHGPIELAMCDLRLLALSVAADLQFSDLVHVHDGMPTLVADGRLLRHVFENLIGNAVKYQHPDRPAHIEISAGPHPQGWQVNVDDRGPGVLRRARERVFDMFVRAVDDDRIEGTGIGLAVCRRAVERHGGRIWVEDAPGGVGARFAFVVPRDLEETISAEPALA